MSKLYDYSSKQFDDLVEKWLRTHRRIATPMQIDESRSPAAFTAIFECDEKDRVIADEGRYSYIDYKNKSEPKIDEVVKEARRQPITIWATRTDEERKNDPMTQIFVKLKDIDAKANCGTVRTLEKIANGIDKVADKTHDVADWLRKVTWKMPNVCQIKFKKEK